MMPKCLIVLAILAVAALPAAAQDVVHLKGGGELVGPVTDGLLEVLVATNAGEVRIPWSRIERIDRGSYVRSLYEERSAGIAKDDAGARFLLALWCRRQGLADAMEAELQKVLEIEPDHAGARAALGFERVDEKWVAGDQLVAAKGFVKRDGRWILEEEARYRELVEARERKLSEPEEKAEDLILKAVDENERVRKYAREALGGIPFESARIPLYRALGHRKAAVRTVAAEELGRFHETEAVRPLLRTAILDTDEAVRTAAVAALRAMNEPEALAPMVRALGSEVAQIRQNAAAAVGNFGDVRGVEWLVRRLGQNWGPSARVNMSVLNQVSYIQDFDVEIAQAAQIGDPIVGILREGVILDVRVLGVNREMDVVERRMIRRALVNLTGEDQGDDATAWADWWGENRDRLLAKSQ